MAEQPTCEERIGEHLKSQIGYFGTVLRVYGYDLDGPKPTPEDFKALDLEPTDDEDERRDMADELWNEAPLAVSVKRVVKVEFSWGGPADWFECEVDEDGTIDGPITYHFSDWFDHAERQLSGAECDVAEAFLGHFTECAS